MWIKSLAVATLALSFSAIAANGQPSGIFQLEAGDVLTGIDVISQKNCSVEIVDKAKVNKKIQMTLVLTVGDRQYEAMELKQRFILPSSTMYAELFKEVKLYSTEIIDAYLQEGRLSKKRSFLLGRTTWRGTHYKMEELIDCKFD